MTIDQLFARTEARYRLWDQTVARNAEIRQRVRSGEPIDAVAGDHNLAPAKVKLIAGLFGV